MPHSCQLKVDVARTRMLQRQLTQNAVALACRIDVRTVQRWFAGQPVSRANAELVARLLGVGTAELFTGLPDDRDSQVHRSLRLVQRLASARDNAFTQSVRLTKEYFDAALQAVSFDAHPLRGFVSRHSLVDAPKHGFAAFELRSSAPQLDLEVRCQLGRHFGMVVARLRLREHMAYLVEVWQTHSMLATRRAQGELTLWVWIGLETRELVFVSDRDVAIRPLPLPLATTLSLDQPESEHVLCVRPHTVQLRSASLPMGFDRVVGKRAGRVDIPVEWDALASHVADDCA